MIIYKIFPTISLTALVLSLVLRWGIWLDASIYGYQILYDDFLYSGAMLFILTYLLWLMGTLLLFTRNAWGLLIIIMVPQFAGLAFFAYAPIYQKPLFYNVNFPTLLSFVYLVILIFATWHFVKAAKNPSDYH